MISSHRVSAIRDATWIIVLDEGSVIEEGTHAELFARGGRYWSLLRRQQLEESLEEETGEAAVTGEGEEKSSLAPHISNGSIEP